MIWIALLPALASLLITLTLCPLLRRGASHWGLIDRPGSEPHKRGQLPIPTVGGIAIFAAVALPMGVILAAVWLRPPPPETWTGVLSPLAEHIAGLRRTSPLGLGILVALLVMHAVGLVDDRRRLTAAPKLVAQLIVAAGLAFLFNVRVLQFLDDYGPIGLAASVILSTLWIAVLTNAFNMLDNMDGLSGGVAAIIAALYLASTLIGGQWFVAALCALLLGALLGFLVFNFPPAKLYMGDAGSLVVGLLLAVVSVRTTYFDESATAHPANWYGVLMPLLVMAVPLYDFTSVTVIRLLAGKSPFVGDHNHFSHRLARKGLSPRTVVMVIYLATLATGLSGVMLAQLEGWQAAIAAAQTLTVILMLALLERSRPSIH
jgi:UDP-GlcNAc:undecaprenyl-phosphate GlcNAc-1-phosphate transferase